MQKTQAVCIFTIVFAMVISLTVPATASTLATSPVVAPGTIWVGADDGRLPDYNDAIFSLSGQLSVSGMTGAWQMAPAPNGDRNPYWDGPTVIPHANIGNFMTGTGFYTGNPKSPTIPIGKLAYFGNANGSADNFITMFGNGMVTATLLAEMTIFRNFDQVGWASLTTPTVLHPVFFGSDLPDTTRTFDPGTQGFLTYIKTPLGTTYRSYGDNTQHFSVFAEGTVPEPATNILIGSALIFLTCMSRWRQRVKITS